MPLSDPPLNEQGIVTPHNHPGIHDDHRVIRRISDEHIVPDEKAPGGRRVSTLAFQSSTEGSQGMSVDLEASIIEAGLDAATYVTTPKYMGSVWFLVLMLRNEAFVVGYEPIPENVHHGEVWGAFTRGRRNKLLNAAQWFGPIPNVALATINSAL